MKKKMVLSLITIIIFASCKKEKTNSTITSMDPMGTTVQLKYRGVLRANAGTQVYNIAGIPDFTEYSFALTHCQEFDHLFGSATLY